MAMDKPLPVSTKVIFSQPAVVIGFMMFLSSVYLMKYTTDILGVAPLAMGAIMFISRIWDAVTDPLVGYFSDRTHLKLGRRRPWILASCIPLVLLFFAIWYPPKFLSGNELTVWVGVSIIIWYTAVTLFWIPHYALGAELTHSYHDRTKLFGWRHGLEQLGYLSAVLAVYYLARSTDPRETMFIICLVVVLVGVCLIASMVAFVREQPESLDGVEKNPFRSYKNVLKNKYSNQLAVVYFFNVTGMTSASTYVFYVADYVIGAPEMAWVYLLLYVVGAVSVVPLWVYLSNVLGKNNLWFCALTAIGLSLGSALYLDSGSNFHMSILLLIVGLGAGCSGVVGPSIQADVVDYGESLTGKRSEGAYFALWNLIQKMAIGSTFFITGVILELSEFVPNAVQSEETKTWLLVGFGIVPLFCYLIAGLGIKKFGLNEEEFERVKKIVKYRRSKLSAVNVNS